MRTALIPICLLVFFGACAGKPTPVAPKLADEILKSLPMGRAQLKSARGEARIEFRSTGRRVRFHSSFLVARGEKLYIEFGGFGVPAWLLSVFDGKATIYFPNQAKAYQGSSADGFRALTGTSVPTREAIDILLGDLPPYPQRLREGARGRKGWNLVTEDGDDRVRIEVEPSGWVDGVTWMNPKGRSVRFGAPMELDWGKYPSFTLFESQEGAVEFRIKRVEGNATIPDRAFQLDLPPGINIRPLKEIPLIRS